MQPAKSGGMSRRNVLRTAGLVSAASLIGVPGTALARENKGNNFGNGNGIGVFLNEQAVYKDSPTWKGGVVDMTGEDSVEVVVGAMTSIDMPDVPFEALPVAFAPQAVKVSPGTDVTWTWPSYDDPIPPIPHDVVSLEEGVFDSGMRFPDGNDFTHTFTDAGTYLYYCTPHGAPFPVHPHGAPEDVRIYNEFGMRGAVLVRDE